MEDDDSYYQRVTRIIEKTIHEDIANYYNLKTPNLHYFKKILAYLASIPPSEVNTHNIASSIGLTHQTCSHYLKILNEVGLVRFLYPYEGGHQLLRKPQKIFLNNTSLLNTLIQYLGRIDSTGTERELFFFQALSDANHLIYYSKQADFQTRDTVFEIGGKNKTRAQVKHMNMPAYLVKDDIIMATSKTIPLMHFGFLY